MSLFAFWGKVAAPCSPPSPHPLTPTANALSAPSAHTSPYRKYTKPIPENAKFRPNAGSHSWKPHNARIHCFPAHLPHVGLKTHTGKRKTQAKCGIAFVEATQRPNSLFPSASAHVGLKTHTGKRKIQAKCRIAFGKATQRLNSLFPSAYAHVGLKSAPHIDVCMAAGASPSIHTHSTLL